MDCNASPSTDDDGGVPTVSALVEGGIFVDAADD
jgi:hypothetical protein